MTLYTSKAVAEWIGLTERRVRQLRDEGVICEERPGLYDLKPTVIKYINYLRGAGQVSLQTERMKLTAEKRKAAEMDNEQRRGEIHTADDVRKGLRAICLNARGRLLILPAKLSPKLARMDKQADIFDLLKWEIEDALNELSEGAFIATRDDGEDGKDGGGEDDSG